MRSISNPENLEKPLLYTSQQQYCPFGGSKVGTLLSQEIPVLQQIVKMFFCAATHYSSRLLHKKATHSITRI